MWSVSEDGVVDDIGYLFPPLVAVLLILVVPFVVQHLPSLSRSDDRQGIGVSDLTDDTRTFYNDKTFERQVRQELGMESPQK